MKIQENSAIKMIADITVYDENRDVFLFTEGAGLTVSEGLTW